MKRIAGENIHDLTMEPEQVEIEEPEPEDGGLRECLDCSTTAEFVLSVDQFLFSVKRKTRERESHSQKQENMS